jgi:CubicO group peptidase (beta-lactamase class C family)
MSVEIHGHCDERFLPFKEAFRANFDDGLELGASLGVTYRGKMVVDLWGGFADRKRAKPWQQDTLVILFSTTKILAALALLLLIDRKRIELDATVATYWPEFGQGGKDRVTVRDVLTYRAGVPGFVPSISFAAQRDWRAIVGNIESQQHWFDGERKLCYHPITYGILIGELVRRVDGRSFGTFFREEIAQKAGADIHVGLSSPSDRSRLSGVIWPASEPEIEPGSLQDRVWNSLGPPGRDEALAWEQLAIENPASNGFGNGRSIARICAILAMNGELDGKRYLSPETIDQASSEQLYAHDPFMGAIRLGLGFGLHSEEFPAPTATSFHWGGYGGSWGVMDRQSGISLGYAPNRLIVDMTDGTYHLGTRLNRFAAVLEQLSNGNALA